MGESLEGPVGVSEAEQVRTTEGGSGLYIRARVGGEVFHGSRGTSDGHKRPSRVERHEATFLGVCSVTQSCPTLCDPMGRSLPGSSVHGIFQARTLEWVATAYSRDTP